MRKADIVLLFDRLAARMPEPRSELSYHSAFTLLVAVVLSAQATDAGVNKATAKLFPLADTPEAILALGEEGLRAKIKTIGLFNSKARNVIAMSRILLERYGGEVPHDRTALEALPGVGRKTANVVLNVWFDEPTIAVDTHIFRVSNRTGLAPGKTPLAVGQQLEKAVPKDRKLHAHHWLILHGRYTCKAQRPLCPDCCLIDICAYEEKTAALPAKLSKRKRA